MTLPSQTTTSSSAAGLTRQLAPPALTSAGAPRLSVRAFIHELVDEVFSLDRGLPWTLGQLLLHPGTTIRRYVVQRDPRVTRPIRLLLISLAVAALLIPGSDYGQGFARGFAEASSDPSSAGSAATLQALLSYFRHFDLILVTCWIPAVAAAAQSCYPRAQLNAAEALAFGSYSLALLLWLVLPLGLLPGNVATGYLLLAIGGSLVACHHGYHRPDGSALWRALASTGLALLYLLILFVAGLLVTLAVVRGLG